ncbi:MAG: hypothetical protein QOF60_905 [Actinomycetota bacterium]|nr:hypothetical protein [Actinomycetota bacterium]
MLLAVVAAAAALLRPPPQPLEPAAHFTGGNGYWQVASDGGIFSFGDAAFYGSTGNIKLNQPIVGMAAAPTGGGYWFVASDGGIFAMGDDAKFFGSMGATKLNQPIVGMAATPSGLGYWLVAADGGIFSFGDAAFYGSTGDIKLNQPIVGMAASPTGRGYWFVARDGGIFSFGDAGFFGSAGNLTLSKPIVGMAAAPDGKGYWLVASDGGLFAYGSAPFEGSTGGSTLSQPIVGMASSPTGKGYWFVARDGGIFAFGDAGYFGSSGATKLNQPIVGMAATPRRLVNAVPAPRNDVASVAEDASVDVPVLANDAGLDDGGITVTIPGPPSHGTASVVSGQVRYVPAADYFGNDELTYRVTDVDGDAATAKVSLTVTSVNDAPTVAVTTGLADGAVTNDNRPTYGGTAADKDGSVSKVEAALDGGAYTVLGVTGLGSWSWTPPASLAEGAHTASFRSVDDQAAASTPVSRTFTVDRTAPTVTIDQATSQADPTPDDTVNFTAVFSEPVTGFAPGSVAVAGTAGGTRTVAITGNGTTYTVAVSGLTDGTIVVTVPPGGAADAAGNTNGASTSGDNSVTVDKTAPSVTVNQGASQPDPTNGSSVTFTATFSENVTGFDNTDVTITGTAFTAAPAAMVAVAGGPQIYTLTVTGMDKDGTVVAAVGAAKAKDVVMRDNTASTSTDNTISRDTAAPGVTIKQATAQPDPATGEPVDFTVKFTEAVTGFTASDVTFSGTAGGARNTTVTGSGSTYTVSVRDITDGDLVADVVTGAAADTAGNASQARNGGTTAERTVAVGHTAPNVLSVLQDSTQADPTNGNTIKFSASFSEPVTLVLTKFHATGGAFSATTAGITSSPAAGTLSTSFTINVTGMDGQGTVTLALDTGAAQDAQSNPSDNFDETSPGDRTVTFDSVSPGVSLAIDAGQGNPSSENSASDGLDFTATFTEPVLGFDSTDLTIKRDVGSAFGPLDTPTITVTGSGTTYNVDVSGMPGASSGTVTLQLAAGKATDAAGNANTVAPADATITYDPSALTVAISRGAGQNATTSANSVSFTATFSSSVTDFDASDVQVAGTATGTRTVGVTGSGAVYTITVSTFTEGTITVNIPAGNATSSTNQVNSASTATGTPPGNQVTIDRTGPTVTVALAAGQTSPTNQNSAGDGVDFAVTFVEGVTGFGNADVSVSGSAFSTPATVTVTGTAGGATYNVAVRGMTTDGTVIISIVNAAATDSAGNSSQASSPSPTVQYDATVPTFARLVVEDGSGTVEAWFSEPLKCSTVDQTKFTANIGGLPSPVTAATCSATDGKISLTLTGMVSPTGADVTLVNTVSDQAGNATAAPPAMTTKAAKPPTLALAITSPADNAFTNSTSVGTYSGTTSDLDSSVLRVEVTVDGLLATSDSCTAAGCATWSYAPPALAVGTHTVSLRAFDDGGSRSLLTTRTITVDQTAPTFVSAVGSTSVANQATLTFSEPILCTSVNDTNFSATVNGTPDVVAATTCSGTSSATITLTLAFAPSGGNTVAITLVSPVKDRAGNDSAVNVTRSYVAS